MSLYQHENAEGFGKRIGEHAGLTGTICWILSILYLASNCFGYQYDPQAFLFSLVNKPGWAPVKLNQTGLYGYLQLHSIYTCYVYAVNGPTFGRGPDLQVSAYSYYSNLGYTYSAPSGYSYGDSFTRSFLAGSNYFNPDEIETFYDAAFTSQGRFEDELASLYIIYNFSGNFKN